MRAQVFGSTLLSLALVHAGCGGAAASYPDGPGVVQAQEEWCQSLAKLAGAAGAWEHLGSCKSAFPAGSAAFLRGMTKCFAEKKSADKAPDNSHIVQECSEHATIQMTHDEEAGREVIAARCERAARCEKVSASDCKAGVDKLDNAQRVLLTNMFNRAALHAIASCLSSSSCSDNEEAARDACYKPSAEKLLWFP